MPIAFLDDARYYTDHSFYRTRFDWRPRSVPRRKLLYHCFWSGRLSAHHELCLKSLLITQSLPLHVILWMPVETIDRAGPVLASLRALPYVTVRPYQPEHEARGSVFERSPELVCEGTPAQLSDAFRILVQLKYGGIYFDMDVLFLKDLRPLAAVEFFWQWSNQPYGTNAISHFRKGSANIHALAERAVRQGTCHPARLLPIPSDHDWPEDVCLFPSFVFSPVWIAQDTQNRINDYCNRIDDFFVRKADVTLEGFFPEAYAYHWHNGWRRRIRPTTIMGRLYREVRSRYRRKFAAGLGAAKVRDTR